MALISLLLLVLFRLKHAVRTDVLKPCCSKSVVHAHRLGFGVDYRFCALGSGAGPSLPAVLLPPARGPSTEERLSHPCPCLWVPLPGFVFLHFVPLPLGPCPWLCFPAFRAAASGGQPSPASLEGRHRPLRLPSDCSRVSTAVRGSHGAHPGPPSEAVSQSHPSVRRDAVR